MELFLTKHIAWSSVCRYLMVYSWKLTKQPWICFTGLNLMWHLGVFLSHDCNLISLSSHSAKFLYWDVNGFRYPNLKSVKELIYKRGFGKLNQQRIPLTDNSIVEQVCRLIIVWVNRFTRICFCNGWAWFLFDFRAWASMESSAQKISSMKLLLLDPISRRQTTSCGLSSWRHHLEAWRKREIIMLKEAMLEIVRILSMS